MASPVSAYLESLLSRYERDGVMRLPPVAAMAREAGASATTISRALNVLQAQGRIVVVPRGGIFLAGAPTPASTVPCAPGYRRRWQEIREELAREFHQRPLRHNQPLPCVKDLCVRYDAAHATVARALADLVDAGVLQRRRRRFFYRVSQPAPSHAAIGVVTLIPDIATATRYNARTERFWRALEEQLYHRSLQYTVYHIAEPYRDSAWSELTRTAQGRASPAFIGYILLGLRFGEDADLLCAAVRRLVSMGKPVVVVEDDGTIDIEPVAARFAAAPGVRFLAMGTTTASGERVGRYLLANGHRKVACFSLVDSAVWCRNRVRGIERAYEQAGLRGAVTRVQLERFDSFGALSAAMSRETAYQDIHREVQRLRELPMFQGGLDEAPFFRDNLEYALWLRFISRELVGLYERVLQDTSITAWVTLFDMLGLLTLSWLRQKNVKLPQRLSLLSFDNISESFSAGLSSYDFDVAAVVSAAVSFIVDRRRRGSSLENETEPFGYVSVRGTSGPARAAAPP